MVGIKLDYTKKVVEVKVNGQNLPIKGLDTIITPSQNFQAWTFYYDTGVSITASGNVTVIISQKGDSKWQKDK